MEMKLEVWDSPNSAGIVIDAVRLCKLALDNGISGALTEPSSYLMKSPPEQVPDPIAHDATEDFIAALRQEADRRQGRQREEEAEDAPSAEPLPKLRSARFQSIGRGGGLDARGRERKVSRRRSRPNAPLPGRSQGLTA